MVLEIGFQILPTDRLDHAADPVDVDAVLPARAGIEGEGGIQRREQPGARGGDSAFAHVARHQRIPHIVAEAGRVGHQVPQGDGGARGTQARRAVRREAFQHLGGGQVRQHRGGRGIEGEFALFHQLHGRGAGDGLGHGGDGEHRIRCHRCRRGEGADAEGAFVQRAVWPGEDGDHAGDAPGIGGRTQQAVDRGCVGHGVAPLGVLPRLGDPPRVA